MNLVLGTMNIGYKYSSNANNTTEYYENIINEYFYNVSEPILDTAYYYNNTETEKVLGNIILNKKIKIATKANPWFNNDFTNGKLCQLSSDNLEKQLIEDNIHVKTLYYEISEDWVKTHLENSTTALDNSNYDYNFNGTIL